MKSMPRLLVLIAAFLTAAALAGAAENAKPLYRDPLQPIEKRVEDLLGRMTLEEKVGQMNMPCVYADGLGQDHPARRWRGCRSSPRALCCKDFGPGGGFFTLSNDDPARRHAAAGRVPQPACSGIALEQTRLGIPLLQSEEGTHGLMCPGGTIFPEGPSLGSTWNMELIGRVYATVAKEARSIGVHQNFTLVVEPIRDPRLGRNEEAFSEDPFLCARIAETIVRVDAGQRRIGRQTTSSPGCATIPARASPPAAWSAGPWRSPSARCGRCFCPRGKRASRSAGPWA